MAKRYIIQVFTLEAAFRYRYFPSRDDTILIVFAHCRNLWASLKLT